MRAATGATVAAAPAGSIEARAAECTKLRMPRQALDLYDTASPDELAPAYAAVSRALLRMGRDGLALELFRRHRRSATPDVRSACTLFLALCRRERLDNATALSDGMLTLMTGAHLATRVQPEGEVRAAYVGQMNTLCQQQRLLAMQLADAVRAELDGM